MKLLEMKHRLALETVKLAFEKIGGLVFIGGTALNTFYLDYRFSEDADIGYLGKSEKGRIEALLRANGYDVEATNFRFRDIITLEGTSIKMDVVEYTRKYNGFAEKMLGSVKVKTLKLEEFAVDKAISFFTREDMGGMARDAYDLFSLEKEYGVVLKAPKEAKKAVRKGIVTLDYNVELFLGNIGRMEEAVNPYLRKPVKSADVALFLKKLRGVLDG